MADRWGKDFNMAEEEEKQSKPKKNLFPIIFMVVNLLVMGAGAFLVFSSTLGHEKKSVSNDELNKELDEFRKKLEKESVIYQMETFNANLEGVPRRLVRMDISLEMLDEEGFEEIIGLEAEARDAVIRILNSKTYDDIHTVQGKLKLKNLIITKVNEFLNKGVVQNVYFTDLVIQ
ncbi:MAG: flagellar basal body-associated FliL family protein [Bdellovibrionales bacterium]|nr:flagellar basal body-associated FliL family protein [Bdellovibrionales bacterium]